MNKTQLLCTFAKKNKLSEVITEICETYEVAFGRIYVLENRNNTRELMCTYNIDSDHIEGTLPDTISIHRKKQTNTLYTINALNQIVMLLNNGKLDPNFPIDWEKYKNSLLVTDENGLKEIKTKIFDIIEVEDA